MTAAASPASPASWPPIRRGSSGSVEAVDVAAVTLFFLKGVTLGVATGVTTGNSELKLPGTTVGPGSTGGNGGGAVSGGVEDGLGDELATPTTVVIDALAGESPAPWTVTLSVTCSPTVAFVPSLLVMTTSIACIADRSPTEHVWWRAAGHSVNLGGPEAWPRLDAVALTERAGVVLQIQIKYVIRPPGHTFD